MPLLRAIERGAKRSCIVWHRRAGKDKTILNITIKKMIESETAGTYYYFFPTYSQAKKVIWDGRDKSGMAFLDHFPPEIVANKNSTELKITLTNGSIFQLIGTDNIDSIVGTNPIGCVFSEFSLQNPEAWSLMRPILAENGGWAIFDFTPRGQNHAFDLYEDFRKQMEDGDPRYFAQKLTVDDTKAIPQALIDEERRTMDEELIQQEYYVSFQGVQKGAYYGTQMEKSENSGRITKVPHDPSASVDTWWDLGVSDATSIWFTQTIGRMVHVIDYYEASGQGLPHYAQVLQERATRSGYVYGTHNAPHDISVRDFGSGKSRIETAAGLGIRFKVVPKLSIQEGIAATRLFLERCYFDREKTFAGRNALTNYRKLWDAKRKCFQDSPYHDWSSNGADAFRYLAIGHKFHQPKPNPNGSMFQNGPSSSWMGN